MNNDFNAKKFEELNWIPDTWTAADWDETAALWAFTMLALLGYGMMIMYVFLSGAQ
jgi:hypothetical protein